MKLLIDESVDREIIDRLIDHGYDVLSIADAEPGITDSEVIQRANELSALLVTLDKDFGELVFHRSSGVSSGVVLIRLSGLSAQRKAEIVIEAFHRYGSRFMQNFSVIGPGRVRIQSEL
jgi:predicted nuclease of predicted toxin-antitoxin system